MHHLALVVAGMANWPQPPNQDTLFHPSSSMDAHVLLQLKGTKEVTMGR
jgi:hypothetical protein